MSFKEGDIVHAIGDTYANYPYRYLGETREYYVLQPCEPRGYENSPPMNLHKKDYRLETPEQYEITRRSYKIARYLQEIDVYTERIKDARDELAKLGYKE